MGAVLAQAAVLLSRDVKAAMQHWRDVLGFSIDNTFGDPPSFAIVRRDGFSVMLGTTETQIRPRREHREGLFDAYFWVEDAQAEFDRVRARGATIDYEPHLQPYGVLEFGVLDLDGQLIGFGQVVADPSRS